MVSVADFTEAQLLCRRRAGTSNRSRAKLERTRSGAHLYLLAGRIRCEICGRRMQGETVHQHPYYRCRAKTIAPGSALLAEHPRTVNCVRTSWWARSIAGCRACSAANTGTARSRPCSPPSPARTPTPAARD
ncbi:zinc ribbon domain-containing protein [Nocardia arizonensis]